MGDTEISVVWKLIDDICSFLSEVERFGLIQAFTLKMCDAPQADNVFTSESSQWKLQIQDAMIALEKSLQNAVENLVNVSKKTRPPSPCCTPSFVKVDPVTCNQVMDEDDKREQFQSKDVGSSESEGENKVHLPTTKETEAADVLMELSGKAKRKKTFELHSDGSDKTVLEDDRRAVIYAAPIETSYLNHEHRETVAAPGEVSMINEKDLLPLATEVICQYCPQQCEDLVELHEHVLAMHNMSEMCLQPNKKKPDEVTFSDERERTCGKSSRETAHVQGKDSAILPSEDMILPFIPLTQGLMSDSAAYVSGNVKGKQANVGKVDLTGSSIAYAAVGLPVQSHDENILLLMPSRLESSQGPSRLTNNCGSQVSKETYVVYVCAICFHGFLMKHEYNTHMCRGSADNEILETSLIDVVVSIPVLEQKSQSGEVGEDSETETNRESIMKMMQYKVHEKETVLKEFRLISTSEEKLTKDWTLKHSTTGKILTLQADPSLLDQCNIMYRCSECDVGWDDFSSFVKHRMEGPCVFRCSQCSLIYPTPNKLTQHQSSYHVSVEDRTCPVCGLIFEKRYLRNKHLKTQCSKQHKCDECGAVLKNIYSLNDHRKTHQERLFKCTECGASFHRKSVLSHHMRKHTGLKPHQCDRCNLSFYTRQHLQTHQDRHDGNRRHKCTLCDKGFYSKSDRDRHVARGNCSSANSVDPTMTITTDKILAV